MDYNELLSAVKEYYDNSISDFGHSGGEKSTTEEIGAIEEVDRHGGEGQGEDWWRVYFFPKHDIYMKVSGWYSSGNGVDFEGWEDVTQVKPQKKTITVYE
jgi:hypothetical protein